MTQRILPLLITLWFAMCFVPAPVLPVPFAHADEGEHEGGHGEGREHHENDDDHDRARRARQRGEVLPLQRIIAVASARVKGRVAEVEFERDNGVWVYEIRIITPRGRLIDVYVDAKTGRIRKVEDY